ncbi:MAG: SAM hydrolase/SAM-dependent halogenase family protein, partial [Terriglobales bacterium]
MIFLFTDFGAAGIYVGQVKAVLQERSPKVPVIDLLHDAPAFNVKAGAHLLAAFAVRLPKDSVTLAVVDPGVGGPRQPVAVAADGRWFVGPDNGLISVAAARAKKCEIYT